MSLEDSRHDGRVVDPTRLRGVAEHGHRPVAGPLALVLDRVWWVEWALPDPGMPFRQQVLADPHVHLTIEEAERPDRIHGHDAPVALLHGVVTEVFAVDLPARGRVCAVAFRPGGLSAVLGEPMDVLTDRVVRARDLLGDWIDQVRDDVLTCHDRQRRESALLDALRERWGADLARIGDDVAYRTVLRACARFETRQAVSVQEAADVEHVSVRTLQRWFDHYVGVSPGWVLRRHRLQDAAARIDDDTAGDLAALAAELGWADQAHLARDFRRVLGMSPSAYRARR